MKSESDRETSASAQWPPAMTTGTMRGGNEAGAWKNPASRIGEPACTRRNKCAGGSDSDWLRDAGAADVRSCPGRNTAVLR